MSVDSLTTRWIRNAADERAASRGCTFDEARGQFTVDWIQTYCRLYEGTDAPLTLEDWQYDVTMRLFGWVRWSDKWGRLIRRFREASIWVPKKNGKSPTLAAWGLYLLCGDGELGQKVFFAAKDGKQAKEIAGKHAIEMLKQSDDLMLECTINASMSRIVHEPTRSILQPLSSSNARTQESKEGLNGSVLVDECFVAGTMVDGPNGSVEINKVRPGDKVYNATGEGTVLSVSCRLATELYCVEFSDGSHFVCTGSHPVFTDNGWVEASALDDGAIAFSRESVLALWKSVSAVEKEAAERDCWSTDRAELAGADLLLDILREESEEPDGKFDDSREGVAHAQEDEASSAGAPRQRSGFTSSAIGDVARTGRWVGSRLSGEHKVRPGQWIPNALQTGLGEPNEDDRDRVRWQEPLRGVATGAGREKERAIAGSRVVCVSRVERESDCTVFNLRVAGHPSYFANGKLVHNCHVVDRSFINRINRAGISRSEPLLIEVSTAGNNPDGYGYERFRYAEAVEAGTEENDELLTAIYAAPQNLTDQELADDPLKYGRLANPAIGRLVDPDEYLADYAKSRSSIDKLAQFKMYRLNIWQRAANPWLSQQVWRDARAQYTEADCVGLPCWAGLDLSLTRDMSSLAIAFRYEEIIRLLVWFWLPESFADQHAEKAPYRQWEARGALRLIPGDTIDHQFLRPELVEILRKFKPKQLTYDKTFAEQLTADIYRETAIERAEFPQTPLHFTAPCGDFERLLIEGAIQHDGNPVLTWQAGHVCLDRNVRTNLVRPIKPKTGGEHLTIDGIVASLMACRSAMVKPQRLTYYEDNPLEMG